MGVVAIDSAQKKKKESSRGKMNIKWKFIPRAYKLLKAVSNLIHTSELGRLRREKWLNMMVTSQGHY